MSGDEEKKRALDAVLKEYEDLRDETKRRIDQRTHLTELMITIDGTLVGFAIYTGNLYILGIIPFITAFCLLNIKASYVVHKRLTRYVREIIERQKSPSIFNDSEKLWISWETFYREKLRHLQRQKGSRRPIYNILEPIVFLACCVAVVVYSFLQFDFPVAAVISAVYFVAGFLTVEMSRMIDPYKEEEIEYDWHELKPLRPKNKDSRKHDVG